MIYRTYGATGVNVSVIGFGGMRFENQNDVEACAGLVKAAYDSGINYFDTAPGYGKSEDLFGVAFAEMNKTRADRPFFVSTKSAQEEPAKIRQDLEASLRRMGLDSIDFFHVWCIMTLDSFQHRKANGVLRECERMKEEGLIRHICVSTHLSGLDTSELLRDYPFDGVLLGYSAMNFAYRDAGLDAAHALNMGVVVMNPLGGGLIPGHKERFNFVKTREDESVVEAALRFLINDQRITVALVGFSNLNQLTEAISAVNGFSPIGSERIESIRGSLKEAYNELCTGCRYCDSCPEGVPIPKMMEAFNFYFLSNEPKQMIDRLKWHWGILTDSDVFTRCSQCGQCELLCTQKLPIIERLEVMRVEAETFNANRTK
ncbi:MAG: aldo/keto reductase [Candidatus Zhuqueibacterota bacterium]